MTLVVYYAMSAIIGPFVGQNSSAGKDTRILDALRLCTLFCIGSGLLMAAGLALFSGFLPALFSSNAAVVDMARLYLLIAPISYGAYGMVMVMNASFNGLGHPMPAVGISLGRIVVLYLPLAIVGMVLMGAIGIFAAYAIANIVSGIVAYQWAKRAVHRHGGQQTKDLR
jgi:Na+-driven multidrug efflux pump